MLLPACGGLPKQWSNFNAFFNTFYNAKTSFDAGVEKNQTQEILFVEGRPIRIFPSPGQAGKEEFKNAIDKGADILRHHERSDFLDPALFLIGRSYFYRTEYFSALRTFEELRNISSDPTLRQRSVFWTSRTLYEMGQHQQAIQFTEDAYLSQEDWDPEVEAEVALILAEHHIQEGSVETAIQLLDPALPQVEDRDARTRGYFLLGQLLLGQGDHASASVAFNRVARSKDDYELIFQSRKNLAISLRESGNLDRAEEIFRGLIRDDKNIESRNQLRFERARTLQRAGRMEEAMLEYEDVLRDPKIGQERLTHSRAYYEIAEIQRGTFGDYRLAAVYYDSAANVRLSEQERPPDYDPAAIAASFGDYAGLRDGIQRLDSLLALGRMTEEARDSIVGSIREERLAAYLERMEKERKQQNTVVLVDRDGGGPGGVGESQGFLNHLSQEMLMDARLQFRALWGERPLVDDWRRAEAVAQAPVAKGGGGGASAGSLAVGAGAAAGARAAGGDGVGGGASGAGGAAGGASGAGGGASGAGGGAAGGEEGVPDVQLGIDLGEIPVDSASQLDMLDQIHEQMYRLANVFYFSIDQPDSAVSLYRTIADETRIDRLKGQSLYLLSDHAVTRQDSTAALGYAGRVIDLLPASIYALRLSERFGMVIHPMNTVESAVGPAESEIPFDAPSEADAVPAAPVASSAMPEAATPADSTPSTPADSTPSSAALPSLDLTQTQMLALLDTGQVPDYPADLSDSARADLLMMASRSEGADEAAHLLVAEAIRIRLRLARESGGPVYGNAETDSTRFRFQGVEWDGIREAAEEFMARFPDRPDASWVARLKTDLTPPESEAPNPLTPTTPGPPAMPDSVPAAAAGAPPKSGGPGTDPRR